MAKKLTYKFVKEYFSSFGYTLLSNTYINSYTPLKYTCSNGHISNITIDSLRRGCFCSKCNAAYKLKEMCKKIKLSFENIGYNLLSSKYINNTTKLHYTCKNGHKHNMTWKDFQQGCRCMKCHKKSLISTGNPNYKGGIKNTELPLYDTYNEQLKIYHKTYKLSTIVKDVEYITIGINCTNCDKIYTPKKYEVKNRISVIKGKVPGSSYFYCSEECKQMCPIYGKRKFPDGFKSNKRYAQTQWANKVKERDNYICQKCGREEVTMFAHHKTPVSVCNMLSLDLDNGITFCKSCHKNAHKKDGCTYDDLRN